MELNVSNGTIDLRAGVLAPHARESLHTKLADVEFDPKAKALKFMRFRSDIFAGDEELVAYVQRVFGYCLTGATSEQALFVLYGGGANGKSTLVNTLQALIGEYARQTPTESLLKQNARSTTNDLARLVGARVCIASEVANGRRLDEALVKQLTGGDRIAARFLYHEYVEFTPKFKILMPTNYLPEIGGTDHGIWRRIHTIPFEVTIPEKLRDLQLGEKLREELPGILNWAVRGCLRWQLSGLRPPGTVIEAGRNYRNEMDSVKGYVEEMCDVASNLRASNEELWLPYSEWCDETGKRAVSRQQFYAELKRLGYEPFSTGTYRGHRGLRPIQPGRSQAA